jgi:hypothetical protein
MIPFTSPSAPLAHEAPPIASLLFRPGPGLAPEAHRVARALLEDAARNRGGRVSDGGDGTWRLEAAPPALEMARRSLSSVLNGRDAALLTEALAAPPSPLPFGTGPEAILSAQPLDSLLERRPILGFGPGGVPRPAGLRLLPSASAIAAALGPRWGGEPWQAHGWELVARRAMRLALSFGEQLHLDMPPEALRDAPADVLPLLPALALACPPARPFAVAAPGAVGLAMLDPAHLPGTVLHLAFDPALDGLPPGFWHALGPGRVVLEGVADAAALEWGLARGMARFAGPQPDRLLAALRRRAAG